MGSRLPAGNPGGAGQLRSQCLTPSEYNRALNFPSVKCKGSWLTPSLELLEGDSGVTPLNQHTAFPWEQCARNCLWYETDFSSLKGIQLPMDSDLQQWQIFFIFVKLLCLDPNSCWAQNHIIILPCFEDCWWMQEVWHWSCDHLTAVSCRQQIIQVVHKVLSQFSECVVPALGKSHKSENSPRMKLINHSGWSSQN